VVLTSVGCTDDPRPSASREQIEAGLSTCGVTDAQIKEGLEDVTTEFVVNFSSETDYTARECFDEQMQSMDVLQTTAWSG